VISVRDTKHVSLFDLQQVLSSDAFGVDRWQHVSFGDERVQLVLVKVLCVKVLFIALLVELEVLAETDHGLNLNYAYVRVSSIPDNLTEKFTFKYA
jgi:hypothetical protein